MITSQMMLAAEKMSRIIEERVARKERGESTPDDDSEVSIEWV
jgi:hypothetical protein